MSCHEVAAALVDEHLPPPPGMGAHLEHCAACRSLARLHASARGLELSEPPVPAAFSPEAIRGVVRRRQRRRRWTAGVGAAGAAVLLAVLVSTRPGPSSSGLEDTPVVGGPLEGSLQRVAERAPAASGDDSGQPAPLFMARLLGEVRGYTRTRPGVEDPAYGAFGPLAAWVRPPDATALEAEPFRTALAAFHVSQ